MATTIVSTPTKSHTNLFSSRTAGGRLLLTPSPRSRQVNKTINAQTSPFTPVRQSSQQGPFEPSRVYTATSSLQSTFANLTLSSSKHAIRASPKSSITRPKTSPVRLELGISEWTLTGTGPAPTPKGLKSGKRPKMGPGGKNKTMIRVAGDRFIPQRGGSPTGKTKAGSGPSRPGTSHSLQSDAFGNTLASLDMDEDITTTSTASSTESVYPAPQPEALAYQSSIASACGLALSQRILAFKPAPPESSKPIDLRSQYNRPVKPATASALARARRIMTTPDRVLDAPGLMDDYYLNLLDWGSTNMVAIALERNVYVWNADSGSVSGLLECSPDTYVSSVKWSGDGAYVAVGLGTGVVEIWDVEEGQKIRSMRGDDSRVGSLAWNKHLLTTGSRSGAIFNNDVRIADHRVATLASHTAEVCGLEWRPDNGAPQLASGGNDNLVSIWDARSLSAPKFTKTNHTAAVKALSWCPWQSNLLASGGGSNDRHIHFWNTTTGARCNSIDTGSQVTGLKFSSTYKEIASTHGYPNNAVCVWQYPTLVRSVEISAHESRVVGSALNPDGSVLATVAADENVKFWKLFEKIGGKGAAVESTARGKGEEMGAKTIR